MIIAFLAIRGGSKGIPQKNIKKMDGLPLYWYVALEAFNCKLIAKVYIVHDFLSEKFPDSSDNIEHIKVPEMDDSCIQEDVMIPFAREHDFEHIVLLQATSPLLTSGDLTKGIQTYLDGGYDSLVSVCRQKRLLWGLTSNNHAYPLNYNPNNRQRRQQQDGLIVENGAFFITSKEALLRSGSRISGNTGLYFMPEDTYQEIDTPSDWEIVEMLLKRRLENG
jgi:N-acylneuraminate cytidylyltransferase